MCCEVFCREGPGTPGWPKWREAVMSLKDVIFISLIILSGLIFYLHGLDAGIRRTRRLFERYLGDPKAYTELPPADTAAKAQPGEPAATVHVRGSRAVFSQPVIQGIFGKN
jgi:hypothetical protein